MLPNGLFNASGYQILKNLENWNKTTKLVSSNWLLNNLIFDNVLFMYFINNVTIILKPHP